MTKRKEKSALVRLSLTALVQSFLLLFAFQRRVSSQRTTELLYNRRENPDRDVTEKCSTHKTKFMVDREQSELPFSLHTCRKPTDELGRKVGVQ